MALHRSLIVLSLLAACSTAYAQKDVSKVNGSVEVAAGEHAGSASTVNGSVNLADGASVSSATTVNGSIKAGNAVTVTEDATTVNGGIRFGTRATVNGDITTVNGDIYLPDGGNVKGGVTTVNGGIGLVRAQVGKDVTTVNGDVTIGVGSHVAGKLIVKKSKGGWNGLPLQISRIPTIIIGPDAVVQGGLVFEHQVKLYVHSSAKTGPIEGATAIAFSTPTAPVK
ncbi:hypothetical protein [Solilutibacter silvestris]|uniref:Polymer-forming cytoskeletal n=1 Tax=Solilutibacter silvestris TaxID=1645665 RepID=A0A2K1Q1K0_9GAMM|nr:hypothetical protein [Lysobacter silvestris]PNS08904.1 hypothetical protein Lysil_0533 [Lysobacter silvestris]